MAEEEAKLLQKAFCSPLDGEAHTSACPERAPELIVRRTLSTHTRPPGWEEHAASHDCMFWARTQEIPPPAVSGAGGAWGGLGGDGGDFGGLGGGGGGDGCCWTQGQAFMKGPLLMAG